MSTWRYSALSPDQTGVKRGEIEATSESEARMRLDRDGLTPIKLVEANRWLHKLHELDIGRQKAKPSERAILYRSIAMSAATNQPLVFGLESALTGLKRTSKLRPAINRISSGVLTGTRPEDAFKNEAAVVGDEAAAIWETASMTREPEKVWEDLATITEENAEIAAKLRTVIYQPLFQLFIMFAAAILMIQVSVPQIVDLYGSFDAEIPAATRRIIAVNEFFETHGLKVVAALLIVAGSGIAANRNPVVNLKINQAVMRIPLFGRIVKGVSTQFFCVLMGLLMQANVNSRTALTAISKSVPNKAVQHQINAAAVSIRDMKLPEAINMHLSYLDPMLESLAKQSLTALNADAAAVGWQRYGSFVQRQTFRQADSLINKIKNVMPLLLGAVVMGIAFATFVPLFTFLDVVGESTGGG